MLVLLVPLSRVYGRDKIRAEEGTGVSQALGIQ